MRNPLRWILGAGLLASAGLLPAWTATGDRLDLSQRDFRLFDNFTQATLHGNLTPHPNWPGSTDVELAAWKAGAEWGSLPMGLGDGDPSQDQVGSGDANFDFLWNGNAAGIGSANDNIISAIPGSSGGVLWFTELPSSDGWRMRVYEDLAAWDDGPGDPVPGALDFQGVLTHELGHVLGLGHSSVPGATMSSVIAGTGVAARSIEADDQIGLQSIYGLRSRTLKPRIDGLSGWTVPGATVTIVGANFSPAGNEIWFNNALADGGAAGGEPFVLSGIASPGGSEIVFTMPPGGAEDGAVHVRNSLSGDVSLSEAHPFRAGSIVDTVRLSGPESVSAGAVVALGIANAPPSAPFRVLASARGSGSILQGHPFDVGLPVHNLGGGRADSTGAGGFTSPPVPPRLAGRTIYLELAAASGGQLFDSNLVATTVL
ncbi:MAG: matrixin family metalloprotease [Planctomycetota bacterium]|nr:MAG: matrixin family metalloprotease [Planctomycetota bacterium]